MRSKSVSVSDRRAGEKSGVSGNTGIVPEMDDAVEGLGYGNKPLFSPARLSETLTLFDRMADHAV